MCSSDLYSSASWTMSPYSSVEILVLTGTDPLDATGNQDANVLLGNIENNVLRGLGGDDFLSGGKGNDLLEGGDGSDTYEYSLGDGLDEIREVGSDSILRFADLSPLDVSLWRSPLEDSYFITIGDGEGRIDLVGEDSGSMLLAEIQFQNDVVWDINDIRDHISIVTEILGTSESDYLIGSEYDEQLFGFEQGDVLEGGLGNDLLNGGPGSDYYIYVSGDGVDRIEDEVSLFHYDGADPDANDVAFEAGILNALIIDVASLDTSVSLS